MNIHVHEAKPKLKDKIRIMKKMKSSGAFQVTNFMYKNNKWHVLLIIHVNEALFLKSKKKKKKKIYVFFNHLEAKC